MSFPFDPEGIPDALKERDQWLLARHDKAPLTPDGQVASWNDPNTWLSFEEALEYVESGEFAGIGYALSKSDPYVVIDLDGCLKGEFCGPLKEWVPDISLFEGTMVLFSSSGTGLHIFVEGELPDWWTNVKVGDDHENIEAYEEKFFVLTGHPVDLYNGSDIKQIDPTPFLETAHEEITGDRRPTHRNLEPDPERVRGDRYEWTDELVEEALDHLDPNMGRDKWLRIGYALYDYDASDHGRALFESWSRSSSKWDAAAKNDVDWIWSNAKPGDAQQRISIGTLRYLAEQNGWDYQAARSALDGDGPAEPAGEAAGDAPASWAAIAARFESQEKGSTTRAFADVVERLLAEHDFAAVRETGEVYHYDPDAGFYRRHGDRFIEHVLEERLEQHTNNDRVSNIVSKIARREQVSLTGAQADRFTPPEGKLCLATNVLDVRTRETEPHSPDYYFTAGLPVTYDPDAECPTWRAFLEEVVPDDDDRLTLQEYVGYCLEAWHHRRAKNLFNVGPTAAGKSTFSDTVVELFGGPPTVSTLSPQQLVGNRFDSSALREAMVNIRNDINATKIEDSGTLKTIFAGETIKTERKFQDAEFYAPKAKHIFNANWLPRVVGEDEALYRRVLIVEFPESVDEADRDRDLGDRLTEPHELSGILNWALDGLDRLREQGHFTTDTSVLETRLRWLSWRSAPLRYLYASGEVEVTGSDDDIVGRKTAYHAYKEWAAINGFDIRPRTSFTNFWKQWPGIETADGVRIGKEKLDVFTGVRWITGTDARDEPSHASSGSQAPAQADVTHDFDG